MAPSVSASAIVACPNATCRSYQLQRAVSYPTVAAGVFLVGALHCADCGGQLVEAAAPTPACGAAKSFVRILASGAADPDDSTPLVLHCVQPAGHPFGRHRDANGTEWLS